MLEAFFQASEWKRDLTRLLPTGKARTDGRNIETLEELHVLSLPTTLSQQPGSDETTGAAGPGDAAQLETLGHLLVEAAIQCPEADAVIGDFGSVSYSDLLIRAQNIALVLRRHGAGPGQFVGVAIDPSPLMLASIAGTVLTGAAYVLLKKGMEKAASMQSIGLSIILCDGSTLDADTCELWGEFGKVLDAARMEQETMPLSDDTRMASISTMTIATLLLDENADGELKAIRASHGTIARLSVAAELPPTQIRFGAGDIFLLHGRQENRPGLFEIWSSLLHGASLAIEPMAALESQAFSVWLRRAGVSVLCLPVARVHAYFDQVPELFANLRHLIIESDGKNGTVSPQRVESLLRRYPHLHIVHTFATPGIAGYAAAYHVPARYAAQSDLPIGVPREGLKASILDRSGQPVRAGEIGELVFSGAQVGDEGVCRTGERARLRADGLLEMHGHAEAPTGTLLKTVPAGVSAQEQQIKGESDPVGLEEAGKKVADEPQIEASPQVDPVRALSPGEPFDDRDVRRVAGTLQAKKQSRVHSLSGDGYQQRTLDHLRKLWLRLLHCDEIGWEDDFYKAGGTQVRLIRMHAELNRTYPGAITMSQLSSLTSIRKIYDHLMQYAVRGSVHDMVKRGA